LATSIVKRSRQQKQVCLQDVVCIGLKRIPHGHCSPSVSEFADFLMTAFRGGRVL
jgi:hypothetical protein